MHSHKPSRFETSIHIFFNHILNIFTFYYLELNPHTTHHLEICTQKDGTQHGSWESALPTPVSWINVSIARREEIHAMLKCV